MLGGRERGAGSDGRRGEGACGAHKLGARPAKHREGLGGGHCVYVGVGRATVRWRAVFGASSNDV